MKKAVSLFLCILLLPVLMVQAAAVPVADSAGLLTASEVEALAGISQEIKEDYGLTAAILTLSSLEGKSAQSYADDYFEANYGYDGVLFLLDMGSRSWHISTDGAAIGLLTDHDLEQIETKVIHYFSDGRYYEGFRTYLDILPGYLEPGEDADFVSYLMICAVPGALIAAIILLVMRSSMNSKKPRHSAADYTVGGSWHLRSHSDLFLYSNVTRRAKPKNNSSGGSTTHRSSSGRSHGGRGGKF